MYIEIIVLILILFIGYLFSKKYVVSLTTIPSRINEIKPTIDSLKAQFLKPQKIIVNIPKRYERFGTSITKFPEFLENDPMIQINLIEEDYGPGTKMLGMLNLDIPPNMIVLVCDDDAEYGRFWSCILLKGILLNPSKISCVCAPHHKTAVFGNGGWGFYRKIIDKTKILNSYYKNKNSCNLVDDDFFTSYFGKKNINCVGIWGALVKHKTKSRDIDGLRDLKGNNSRKKLTNQCKTNFM